MKATHLNPMPQEAGKPSLLGKPTCDWMVRGTVVSPAIMVQVLVLVLGVYGDFVNFKMTCRLSLSDVLIGIGYACVHSRLW